MTESELLRDPIQQFHQSFEQAKVKSLSDHIAMTLSTCSTDGKPSSRVALLKLISPEGFTFFTNYNSRKSIEIKDNPNVTMCFYWPELNHQVRIDGVAEKAAASISDAYFASRPRISQLGAWASHQSEPLVSRDELMKRLATIEQKYENHDVPRPEHWGGWLVRPTAIEFWYNGDFRLHDRFVYTRDDSVEFGWKITRLNP